MTNFDRAREIIGEARALLAPFGLLPFGWFTTDDQKPALLIGNIGSSLWPGFSASAEFEDGEADALDRWTVASIAPVASELKAEARFPFGEPRWPFQVYAKAATGMNNSPIGLLIHPEYGLWSAFRAVLVFDAAFDVPIKHVDWHPCDRCVDKPCLNTCPIDAFQPGNYDYMACRAHVRSDAGYACKSGGCLARHACPVGQDYAYEKDHQAFHMAAYV